MLKPLCEKQTFSSFETSKVIYKVDYGQNKGAATPKGQKHIKRSINDDNDIESQAQSVDDR